MSLVRRSGETQRAFVERVLAERGAIGTYDFLFDAHYADGRPTSITRLAAIVHDLRTDGWDIATHDAPGELARYQLIASPRRGWRCAVCGGNPAYEPRTGLGGMAQGKCQSCGPATFRWAA